MLLFFATDVSKGLTIYGYDMINERDLVARVLAGDFRAFEHLVTTRQKLVFHIIARLVNNREDMEDICQEVFIKVHRNLRQFRFESKLSTWVAHVAYGTAVNYLKKHKRNQPGWLDPAEDFQFTGETPETVTARKNESEYIQRLILQMPLPYKTVITLYHLENFSIREIHEITGMPEGTVKSLLSRGRKLLKDKIEAYE